MCNYDTVTNGEKAFTFGQSDQVGSSVVITQSAVAVASLSAGLPTQGLNTASSQSHSLVLVIVRLTVLGDIHRRVHEMVLKGQRVRSCKKGENSGSRATFLSISL